MKETWDMSRLSQVQIRSSAPIREEEDLIGLVRRMQEEQNRKREISLNSIGVFIREATEFDMENTISSQQLYDAYHTWCHREGVVAETMRTFCYRLKHGSYRVKATVFRQNGKQCRGFRGIRIQGSDTCDT